MIWLWIQFDIYMVADRGESKANLRGGWIGNNWEIKC